MGPTAHGQALFDSFRILARSTPGASLEMGPHGVGAMIMTTPFALFNGVITTTSAPDAAEVDRWAGRFRGANLPWSIQLRGNPGPEVVAVAASYGLTDRHLEPLMVAMLPGRAPRGWSGAQAAVAGGAPATVSRVGATAAARYLTALAEGSGAPAEALAALASSALLDDPAVAAYLALSGGEPVATGMTTLAGGVLGVLNMSTVPAHRHRGHARAVLAAMLDAGARSGAQTALLQANDAAMPLYESVGFQTVETWTYLLPPDGSAAPLTHEARS